VDSPKPGGQYDKTGKPGFSGKPGFFYDCPRVQAEQTEKLTEDAVLIL
jgi:hypothetical protein